MNNLRSVSIFQISISGFTVSSEKDMIFKTHIAKNGTDQIVNCVNRYSNNPSDIVLIMYPEGSSQQVTKAWQYSPGATINVLCMDIYLKWNPDF